LILLSLVALSRAALLTRSNLLLKELPLESAVPEPIAPYAFGYTADAIDGSSSRQESSDGSGVVRGSYTLSSADGIKRVVNYIADENGFRAQVQTNEPGTESQSPANVVFESSQLPAEQIALKYGPRPNELPDLRLHQTVLKESPKAIKLIPIGEQTLTPVLQNKQKLLVSNFPTIKKVESVLPSNFFTNGFALQFPTLQTELKTIETPIKLLTQQNLPLLNSQYEPQIREE